MCCGEIVMNEIYVTINKETFCLKKNCLERDWLPWDQVKIFLRWKHRVHCLWEVLVLRSGYLNFIPTLETTWFLNKVISFSRKVLKGLLHKLATTDNSCSLGLVISSLPLKKLVAWTRSYLPLTLWEREIHICHTRLVLATQLLGYAVVNTSLPPWNTAC